MRLKLKNRKKYKCSSSIDSVSYCISINDDTTLFFSSEKEMLRYLDDYSSKCAIYCMSMFKVQFFNYVEKNV